MYQKVKIDEMWAKDFAGDEIMCIFVGMKNDTPTYNLLIAMGTNHNQDHNMAFTNGCSQSGWARMWASAKR